MVLAVLHWVLQRGKNAAAGVGDNNPVGTSKLLDQSIWMPSPAVSPVMDQQPWWAATRLTEAKHAKIMAGAQYARDQLDELLNAETCGRIPTGIALASGRLPGARPPMPVGPAEEGTAKSYRDALSGKATVSGVHVDGVPAEDAGQRMPNSSLGIADRDLANRTLDALDELKWRELTKSHGGASDTFKSKEAAEAKAAAGTAAHNQGAAQLAYTRLGGNTFYLAAGNSADASQQLGDAGIPGGS